MHSPSLKGGCQGFNEIMDENVQTVIVSSYMSFHSFVTLLLEPVTIPQILVHSSSITPGWCNVTMECRTSGDAEDLKVTWEGKGLPKELEEKVMPGPAYNSHTLAVNLPLGKPYTNITCVVSNQVDQKTDTFDLGRVCDHGEYTCRRGGVLSELGCSGMKVSPHCVISTTFHRVTLYRSLGSTSRLCLLFSVSQSRLFAPAGPDSSLLILLPTLIHHSLCV